MPALKAPVYRPPLAQHLIFAVFGLVIYAEIISGAYFAIDRIGDELARPKLDRSVDGIFNSYDGKSRIGWNRSVSISRNWSGNYHVRGSLTPPPGDTTPDQPPPINVDFQTTEMSQGEYTYAKYEYQTPKGTINGMVGRETTGYIVGYVFKKFGFILIPFGLFGLFVLVVWVKLLNRAGYPGYYALLPGVNVFYVMTMAVKGLPKAWLLMFAMFVPGVNSIAWIFVSLGLARNFGRSTGFAVGLILMPMFFLPVLAFGKAKYQPDAIADDEEDADEDE
ncbi:DUF5684 domain-containing protein [Zavarzinella formosa]|uniref:DUF5684 domain-containing protein n=1 Tax=Zavarzinella formosa TaxID=360055 RepID=UPI00030CE7A5|nr:DUF5684 domain-containing protein [Zavarzinella formosa]